ncbi:MAG: hypothetical protein MJE66_05540 [Proteobacteria bacterium]|nr:hypothetical protein [Pseudomonadota bacterium]
MSAARALAVAAVGLSMLACTDSRDYSQAVCVLVDVSGTYVDEKPEVARILKRDVLPTLVPGDTFMLIRIDGRSYEKENVETLVTLDARPSRSNAQKLALAKQLDEFSQTTHHASHTDIPGAMMLGAEYLREQPVGSRVMLVFSDLREDLPKGASRNLGEAEFEGIELVALNVKRLAGDNLDPSGFRERLAEWEARATKAKAEGWTTFMDPNQLSPFLAQAR